MLNVFRRDVGVHIRLVIIYTSVVHNIRRQQIKLSAIARKTDVLLLRLHLNGNE